MSYDIKGRMAEVCTCHSICPCAVGLAPDNNVCEFSWVFAFDEGTVAGEDVSGLRMGILGRLDGSVTDGSVRAAIFIDDRSSEAQEKALISAFTGELGGPLADLASLVAEVAGVTRVPIELDVDQGTGRFRIGEHARGGLESLKDPSGAPARLTNFALAPLGHIDYPGLPTDFEIHADDLGFRFTPNSASSFEFHHQVA